MRGVISPKLFLALAALTILPILSHGQAGSLDASFGANGVLMTRPPLLNVGTGAGAIGSLVELKTGELVGLATATDDPNTFRNVLVRVTADGALDSTFGMSGYVYIPWTAPNSGVATKMAVQSMPDFSERILIAGGTACGGKTCTRVERYTASGDLDLSFGTNGVTILQADTSYSGAILILPDGKIVVGGGLNPLVRLNADGTPDTNFGPGGVSRTKPSVAVQTLELQNDGKIIAAGTISAGNTNNFGIARYDSAGRLDTSFGSSGKTSIDFAKLNDIAIDVAVDEFGRILVCGEATYAKTNPAAVGYDAVIVRLTPSGKLDGTFGSGGKTRLDIGGAQDEFTSIALQADGRIVVAGEGRYPGAKADVLTARYTADGQLDSTYSDDGWNLTDLSGNYDSGQSALLQYDTECGCVKLVVGALANGATNAPSYHAMLRYML